MIKVLVSALCIVLAVLQYKFWFGSDSILKVRALKRSVHAQELELSKLQLRNQQLIAKIESIRGSPAAVEEQARYELGMVKQGETYYQVVEPID